jgi:hypothetical protein
VSSDVPRRCTVCSSSLPSIGSSRRVYCSGRCRTKAYEQRKAGVEVTPAHVAEVIPIAPNGRLDEALARALDPKRLLAIVAAHAGARQPTSWRAAMELLRLQGVVPEAGQAPAEPVRDVWLELDELDALDEAGHALDRERREREAFRRALLRRSPVRVQRGRPRARRRRVARSRSSTGTSLGGIDPPSPSPELAPRLPGLVGPVCVEAA